MQLTTINIYYEMSQRPDSQHVLQASWLQMYMLFRTMTD